MLLAHTTFSQEPPFMIVVRTTVPSHTYDPLMFNADDVILIDDDDNIVSMKLPHNMATAHLIPGIELATAKFPTSFFAVDVHATFCFKPKNKRTMESQFEHFFGVPWKSSTYYDHKARWYDAPPDARDHVIAAGYSDAGCYGSFLKAHPIKNAELKAAKWKLQASQHS